MERQYSSLVHLAQAHADRFGARIAFHFLDSGLQEVDALSFGALDLQARALAAGLQRHVQRGAQIVLMLPAGADFIRAFFGCLYALMTAIPVAPAMSRRATHTARIEALTLDADAVVLESLPLTANGKVDRKGLPAPEGDAYARGGYEPAQGEVEQVLAGIWQELLQLERVGRHDNFFELGGHSLHLTTMLARVNNSFGTELPLIALFECATVADLGRRVESIRWLQVHTASATSTTSVEIDLEVGVL